MKACYEMHQALKSLFLSCRVRLDFVLAKLHPLHAEQTLGPLQLGAHLAQKMVPSSSGAPGEMDTPLTARRNDTDCSCDLRPYILVTACLFLMSDLAITCTEACGVEAVGGRGLQ